MFIGHFAPAFVAAAITPQRPRLGLMFIAAQLVDWAFFLFVLIGVEDFRIVPGITAMNPLDFYHYPYTHSLLGSAGFAAAFALLVLIATRDKTACALAGLVVLSHWLLDLIVHRPDLTFDGNEPKYGLGLWNYPWIEMPLELALTFGAMALFISRTRGYVLPALVVVVLLLGLQAVNWFGPEPDAVTGALAYTGFLAFGLLTVAASWLGRKRRVKAQDEGLADSR